jgi:DNA-binding transcriptional ArsR family regulator
VSNDFDQRFRALASPTRRLLLNLCWDEPRAAGDLSSRIDLAPATVSEHLKSLMEVGLIDVSRTRTWRFYRTNHAAVAKTLSELLDEFPSDRATKPQRPRRR